MISNAKYRSVIYFDLTSRMCDRGKNGVDGIFESVILKYNNILYINYTNFY